MDEPSECMRVAIRVADTHGLQVVNGWALTQTQGAFWHNWNHDPATGAVIDAANARRVAIGYYGKTLDPVELDRLRASSELPTGRELLEVAGSRVAGFGRVLSAMLGD